MLAWCCDLRYYFATCGPARLFVLQKTEEDMHVSASPSSPASAQHSGVDDDFADLLKMTPILLDAAATGDRYSAYDLDDPVCDENAGPNLTAFSPLMLLEKPASAATPAKQPLQDSGSFSFLGQEQLQSPSLQPLPQATVLRASTPRRRGVWGAPQQTTLKSSFAASSTAIDDPDSHAQASIVHPA